jgi:hypothetical protein
MPPVRWRASGYNWFAPAASARLARCPPVTYEKMLTAWHARVSSPTIMRQCSDLSRCPRWA